jgi:uncharacterized phage protein (TIGR02220 family)
MGQNLLYRELLDYANDHRTLDKQFRLKNSSLASRASQSEAALKKNRNALVQLGLIEFDKGIKDKRSPGYQIIKLYQEYGEISRDRDEKVAVTVTPTVASTVTPIVAPTVAHSTSLLHDKDLKDINHSPAKAEPAVDYEKLFEYLNKKSGKHFRNTPTNQKLVKSRLDEGFTPQDIKDAIDHVCAGWLGTDMARYIQPSTIFRASKFEGYVNSVPGGRSNFSGGKSARKEDTPGWMQPGYTPESKPATPESKASIQAGLDELKAMREAKASGV